jgi:glycosyltransferase involved in cell wall biosynthesis
MCDAPAAVVSVVIPTRNRPHMVARAVHSVLKQTFQALEAIVIVDGPDSATVNELHSIDDIRLHVIELNQNVGAAQARNLGVAEAKGDWIAFLDDDDEWLPEKTEKQLALANRSVFAYPILSSQLIARMDKEDAVWPRRFPKTSEHLSEYLFVRNSPFLGEAIVQTSTILTKKELLRKFPLPARLTRHEELDWLLQVSQIEGVGIEFVREPLIIWQADIGRKAKRESLSNVNDWKYSLDWIKSIREYITPLAYSGFITTYVSAQASFNRDWKAFFILLFEFSLSGKFRPTDLTNYLAMWFLPRDFRQLVRRLLQKNNSSKTSLKEI